MEDYFEPAIHIVHNDGNPSTLLKYVSHTRNQVSPGVDEVVITMQDDKYLSLIHIWDRFKNFVSNLRYYGRMSLTNYITQSIAGAIIYFPFGLYLAPYCGYTLSLLVGFVLFLLQVQFCKWWLKGHKQGPLESLWPVSYTHLVALWICDFSTPTSSNSF